MSIHETQRLSFLSSLDIFNQGSAIGYRRLCQTLGNTVPQIDFLISGTCSDWTRKEYEIEAREDDSGGSLFDLN
jgi:hypothetical protein